MKGKSSHKPQFLKPILPDSFQKISIPIAFHKYLVGEKSDIAILKSPLGKSWSVKVKGCINGVFFEKGWEDFVAEHSLCSGDILVFQYEGNMVFNVTVFDKTACEKSYEKKTGKQRERKNEEHVKASKVPPHSGEKKVGIEGSSSYKPKAPHFVTTIKPSNLSYDYLNIPRKFVVANSLGNVRKITIKDPERRSFPVTMSRNSLRDVTFFAGGWRRFALSNKLEEGDECIFELMAKDVMEVRISKR
ncbi:B3 domain-containing protein REM10-like [Tasmannia lanceolata]|uniref:B3 domain-containing protein REM10-like n=1 Tax=Tasmannia lanceolata TaxID=3420 RepID=UPI0040645286